MNKTANATQNYIAFDGSGQKFDEFLMEYFPPDQIKLVRNTLPLLRSALNNSEVFEKKSVKKTGDESMMHLMVSENYHLNMRKTTLALFALVMDIACTKGFATFIFETCGISSHKLRKLNYDEKQIVLLINGEKILVDPEKDEYEINDERDYGYSSEQIKDIIDTLVRDDVVIRRGRNLKIAF